jgi:putative sterol carrier protein
MFCGKGKLMEIKKPREFFEKVLPARFDPKKAAGFEAVVQVNISGADGGEWVVIVKDQKMQVKEGVDSSPSITLKMMDSDFVDLINGKLDAVKAFMTGKLEFKGSLSIGMKLMDIWFG